MSTMESMSHATDSSLRKPTAEQSSVIHAGLEPMLVIAGAGSGKTTTMADRVVYLVKNGLAAPHEILGVTFTKKAAAELASRVRRELSAWAASDESSTGLDTEPTIATYHSYAKTLVADYGLRLGVERDAAMLSASQAHHMVGSIVDNYQGDIAWLKPNRSTLVKSVLGLAADCSEHLVSVADVQTWLTSKLNEFTALEIDIEKPGRKETQPQLDVISYLKYKVHVASMVAEFREQKRQANVLDFGDLIALAATVAANDPAAALAERQKYKVVLLDEFQDTSHAQTELFQALFGSGHPVTAVGDPHQSIYGFRGASAGQLLRFPEVFSARAGEAAQVRTLSTGWRNSLAVLEAANVMVGELNSTIERAEQLGIAQRAGAPSSGGLERESAATAKLKTLEPRPGAEEGVVLLNEFLTEEQEAEAIVSDLAERLSRGGDTQTSAILCRKRAQFSALARSLDTRGIPYEIVGLGGLLETPEVIDLTSMLRVLVDPDASEALLRVLSGARWRIGPRDLLALADFSRSLGRERQSVASQGLSQQEVTAGEGEAEATTVRQLWSEPESVLSLVEALDSLSANAPGVRIAQSDALDESDPNAPREFSAEGFRRLILVRNEIRTLRAQSMHDVLTLLSEIERVTRVDIELAAKPGNDYSTSRRNLDAFYGEVAQFLGAPTQSDSRSVLTWIDSAVELEDGLEITQVPPRQGAVQLLTIHAAKGLEWDNVYVPGMTAGQFTSQQSDSWMGKNGNLPWNLRGDANDRPQWSMSGADRIQWLEALKQFKEDIRVFNSVESRRLAYVAFTRARTFLWISTSRFRGTSKAADPEMFFTELIQKALSDGSRLTVGQSLSPEELELENPNAERERSVQWPYDPLEGPIFRQGDVVEPPTSTRRPALEQLAHAVRDEPRDISSEELLLRAPRWAEEALALLSRARGERSHIDVHLPEHVSASTYIELGARPSEVVANFRRPLPRRPSSAARLGTQFHAWVESYYSQPSVIDIDLDDAADQYLASGQDISELQRVFLASPFAAMSAFAVEVPFETQLAETVVRGRIDAVFKRDDGSWDLIDWKTGQVPLGLDLEQKSVQLAIYRMAWARLQKVDISKVSAAFYYVDSDTVVRPSVLPEEHELARILEQAIVAEHRI